MCCEHSPDTLCVLLVDDNADTRGMLRKAFELQGFCVCESRTAGEAREILRERCEEGDACPDVIIADIDLPDIRGTTFATKVRERYPNMVIHFLTGWPAPLFSAVAQTIDAGITTKPLYDPPAFVHFIRREVEARTFPGDRRRRGARNDTGLKRRLGDSPVEFGDTLGEHVKQIAETRRGGLK